MTPELFVKIATDQWQSQISQTNRNLDQLTDEQLMKHIAPGKNRGIYVLGHLAAVHDRMLPLLRFEEGIYPELKKPFLDDPEDLSIEIPSAAALRQQWHEVNGKLAEHMKKLTPEEWFQRHSSVSEEDFVKEPHRNRLNLLISRTAHLGYHNGQLVLLKEKAE